MGGSQDPLFLLSLSAETQDEGRGKENCLTVPRELPPSTLGRKLVMLVWAGAVLTGFGSTVKEDCQVEKTSRKISLARAPGAPRPGVQSSPKVDHLQSRSSRFHARGPG